MNFTKDTRNKLNSYNKEIIKARVHGISFLDADDLFHRISNTLTSMVNQFDAQDGGLPKRIKSEKVHGKASKKTVRK